MKRFEWEALSQLLKQGYPFQDAYRMIQGEEALLWELQNGTPLADALIQGHRGTFYEHLAFFAAITSLAEAIAASIAIADFNKHMRQSILKQTSYPLILFVFSFMTLFLFSSYIMPQLMQSFDFSEHMSFLPTMMSCLQFIATLLIGSMLLILIAILLSECFLPCKIALLKWIRFTKLPQQYCSYMLAGYYIQMMRHGIATRHVFSFLAQLKKGGMICICADQIDKMLQNGNELEESLRIQPWIDNTFVKYWQMGMHTQNMETALTQYRQRQEACWKQRLKLCAILIQVSAYGFVALMVVLVYQIMLVPLQILEEL